MAAGWLVAGWMGAEAMVRALVGSGGGPCGSWGEEEAGWSGRSVGESKVGRGFGDMAVDIWILSWYAPNPSLSVAFNVNRSLKMNSASIIHCQMQKMDIHVHKGNPKY